MNGVAAALLPASVLDFVQNKTVRAEADIGAEAAFGWFEAREQVALQEFDEKSLRQILRFVRSPENFRRMYL